MGEFPSRAHQWKKGQSGNPKGRASYRQRAEEILDRALNDQDVASIVDELKAKAMDGEPWAIDQILKRALPITERREVEAVEPASSDEVAARVARFPRGNGAAPPGKPADPRRANGAGGGSE